MGATWASTIRWSELPHLDRTDALPKRSPYYYALAALAALHRRIATDTEPRDTTRSISPEHR